MRTSILLLLSVLTIVGCGETETTELSTMIAKRDSLVDARNSISEQLASIEEKILLQDTNRSIRITNVTVLPIEPQRFEHFFTVQGVVETDKNAQLFPETNGRVIEINVSEGDRVAKGQVLLKLDSKIIRNQIDEVKSRLSLAKTVYEKQESLWKQKVGSEIQYLEAKNNYESLQQNLEALNAQLELFTITAPFSGVVDEINPKVGEMASPQFPAIRLVNTEEMYIKADVTERYLGQVKAGDSVDVHFPGADVSTTSVIERIGEFINPNNRTFKIRVNVSNQEGKLKPNVLGELRIRDYMSDSTMVIPQSLVQMTPTGDEFVYVMKDNKAIKTSITTGMTYRDQVEIMNGLSPNDVIIDKGARAIKDGDTVNVI